MTGMLTALWRLLNPVSGTLCLDRPPRGFRLGRCALEPGHDGAHMDTHGSTWVLVYADQDVDEEDDW